MRAFTVIAAVLAAAGLAVAQVPSGVPGNPPCTYSCPSTDEVYNALVSSEIQYDDLMCTYDGYGTCTYSEKTGDLEEDNDGYNCPPYAVKKCYSKRFNIVREISERRAAKASASVPETVQKRASLKKKRVD